jgi:ABC-2 type transport system ATP-binding protein
MENWAIETKDLVKKFPRRKRGKNGNGSNGKRMLDGLFRRGRWRDDPEAWLTAVDGINLQIKTGEVFGLLGPNGAGKSTTIRMICTLLEPTSGSVQVNGYDVVRQANQVRQNLGTVLSGERSIYWKLTARENLEYFAALFHIPPSIAREQIADLLEKVQLSDRADELVEKYSSGMKQRVAIAKALLARPPIVLLDEPTLGLDPQAARKVRELVNELKEEGHTVLLTTHYMEEADQLSDRIGIIDQGRIIALDTPAGLKKRIDQLEVIRVEVGGWDPGGAADLEKLHGVERVTSLPTQSDSIWEINLQTHSSRLLLPELVGHLNHNGTRLVNMNILTPTLEDVFIHLTGKALRD